MVFFSSFQHYLSIKQNLINRKSEMAAIFEYRNCYHGNIFELSDQCYHSNQLVGRALIACQRACANS